MRQFAPFGPQNIILRNLKRCLCFLLIISWLREKYVSLEQLVQMQNVSLKHFFVRLEQ